VRPDLPPRPSDVTDTEWATVQELTPTIWQYVRSTGANQPRPWLMSAYRNSVAAALDIVRRHEPGTPIATLRADLNSAMARAVWGLGPDTAPGPRSPKRPAPPPQPQVEVAATPEPEAQPDVESRPLHEIVAEVPSGVDPDEAAASIVATLPPEARDRYLASLLAKFIVDLRTEEPRRRRTDGRTGRRPPRHRNRDALNADTFPLPDGTLVSWGSATANQHRSRAAWLRTRAASYVDRAVEHERAAAALDEAGFSCLDELVAVDSAASIYLPCS